MSDVHDPTEVTPPELPRRDFLRLAGLGTGALLSGVAPLALDAQQQQQPYPVRTGRGRARASSHIVVVGAGAWGANISWHLRKAGNRVTLIDMYGVANSRSTTGDETRGIRSSYGDRTVTPELWVSWARESIKRWREFDQEHAKRFGTRFFYTTGDVMMREREESFTTASMKLWDGLGVKYERIDAAEAKKRWPQINSDGMGVIVYEPDAGVTRARDSIQAMVALGRDAGVQFRLGKVTPGPVTSGKMEYITLGDGTRITADAFVFACGPWMAKVFPNEMKNRTRLPMGHVCYFATPVGDDRFTFPNIPSWNVPGVTGWAALPADLRGFRVRGGIAPPPTAAEQAAAAAAAASGVAAPPPPRRQGDFGAPNPADPAASDPDLSVRWTNQERVDGSRRVLQKYFPGIADAPISETRACHYESSVNRNFIVDHLPGAENAWVTGMGQAEGFKFSIVVGEYAAWRVMGDRGDPRLADAFKFPTEEYPATPAPRGEEEE